jgi:hypothetical protein
VQRAAEVGYILRGLFTHLGDKELPYEDKPTGNVTNVSIDGALNGWPRFPWRRSLPAPQVPGLRPDAVQGLLQAAESVHPRLLELRRRCARLARDQRGEGSRPRGVHEDLDHLPLATRKTIEIVGFVGQDDIDPLMYDRGY